ncbi:hypothetical protein [Marinigracilibium pacificum]|uniref:3-oxoacyl-ACP synthase n=1 Tax=Marinigracilibium pacificum TaxID=2729599 RepID=A0A848J061_9BACT|nr:hypothetical protein [Marinigracilibium pacificum]NMM47864.1 hypothetical protein [Marinigracilibium pacificum]
MKLSIESFAHIDQSGAYLNGNKILDNSGLTNEDFLLLLYKHIGVKYGKFHKMDSLCKTAFLTAELLTASGQIISNISPEEKWVVIGNNSSSIVSDKSHVKEIEDVPSPAVFVYTLPNIMLGEICIRHKVMGENSCFQMEELDVDFIYDYLTSGFKEDGYSHCITGWVDFDLKSINASLFLISNSDKGIDFSKESILNLIGRKTA